MADDNLIDLAARLRANRVEYIDRQKIGLGLKVLSECADEITRISSEKYGAADPVAGEICAHVNAIQRIIDQEAKTND